MTAYILILAVIATTAAAQQLPDGPGRAEIEKMCKGCHEMARSISLRQDRDGWSSTMSKMTAFGMKATEQETNLALDYLAKHYPAGDVPPLNINKATAIQLESALSLRRSQAAAIIEYRTRNGQFKSIDDLKKIPNIDIAKIESKKGRIVF
ncbi:MAG: helix-hairpin-helix domain-containing protein [Acidobacteria bacterium]|nr:helix-hairpin-helix domain-containing protein [Acidobacteriota bacterium]